MRGLLSSIQRYLNTENYSFTFTDVVCLKLLTMVTLKEKLKASGLGNKPRTSDSLKDEEVEKLYASKCHRCHRNHYKHFLAKFDLYISAKQTK